VLLVVKTRADRARDLVDGDRDHPDLPEVVMLPAVGGSLAYLDWVRDEAAP
jgi:uncharacterized protein involved in tolerance to divalent cations